VVGAVALAVAATVLSSTFDSALYLMGQGDILATAVPGFPVWDLGGLLGGTLWGVWVLALGVAVLRRPASQPATGPAGDSVLAPTA
jgi:hypothetical protein